MIKGFGLLELFVTLTLSVVILSLIISSISESSNYSKKITDNQQLMESIFHSADTIRADLTKCGMRLHEAEKYFNIPLFEYSDSSFKLIYGLQNEVLIDDTYKEETSVSIHRNEYFKKGKMVLIYNVDANVFEFNEISSVDGDILQLVKALQADYPRDSSIIALKQVEYKLYAKQNVLKRKLDRGYFQPLSENVSVFSVAFYPESNSVLYRLELNKREQINGYIFLVNKVAR